MVLEKVKPLGDNNCHLKQSLISTRTYLPNYQLTVVNQENMMLYEVTLSKKIHKSINFYLSVSQ